MATELKRSIDQICKEKGWDRDVLIEAIEDAVKSALKKHYNKPDLELEVQYNDNTGEIEAYKFRTVTEELHDAEKEISLKESKDIDPECEIGDSIGVKLDVTHMGRIAALAARQVIMQKMKVAERDVIYEEFKDRESEIVNGIVQRFEKGNIIINLGITEAALPSSEQIPGESYRRGDRLRALISKVEKTQRDVHIILSRSSPEFLAKLFELEVPEISEGIVKIINVAREPGSRTKIAVTSSNPDVDPVGACVGMRGGRVQSVVQELRGEKIDIVVWNKDPAKYVYNALAPAEYSRVIVDEPNKTLEVIVPDDQLSLAIGRQGQNVRLAARLMGWKIDVIGETRYANMQDPGYLTLLKISDMTENMADKIFLQGVQSLDAFLESDLDELSKKTRLSKEFLATLKEEAQELKE